MLFEGVVPAVMTPFGEDGQIDTAALKRNAEWLVENGSTGLVGTGTMGEAQSLSAAERRLVIETLVEAADGRVTVTAGVSSETPERSLSRSPATRRRPGRRSHDAAVARLRGGRAGDPVLLQRGGRRRRHAADGLQQPEGKRDGHAARTIARLAEIDNVVAVKECSGDARRIAEILNATDALEVLVGGDDWALEGFCAGATGWIAGMANVAPRDCVDLYRLCGEGRLEEAREINARLLPLGRLDMRPKLVQFFKAAQDLVARGRSLPPTAARADRRRAARGRGGGPGARRRGGRLRASRVFAAVDSHTEGMPTRVITGGVAPIPGDSMLERKLHFERHLDDLRLLLMREPRGHGAMSGAILQPPLRDDADWGVLFIEVSGGLPMCGHGAIGVATVLVETGMVESRSRARSCGSTRPPASSRRASTSRAAARARSRSATYPSFLLARERSVRVNGHMSSPTTWPSAAISTRCCRPRKPVWRWIPTRSKRADRPGASRSWPRSTRRSGRCIPRTSASAVAGTWSSLPPARTGRSPSGARPRSIRAGSTARRAAPGRPRSSRSSTRAASSGWARSL